MLRAACRRIKPKEVETFDDPVVENVFLLVGKRENIPAPRAASDPTLDDVAGAELARR